MKKQFVRDNFLGLSLTMIGLLCLVLAVMLNLNHRGAFNSPHFAFAGGNALDGPDIDGLEKQNRAYERIAQTVTPGVVAIQSTQVIKVRQSPFTTDPFFRQFFGSDAESAKPAPPASYQQLPSAEDDGKLELMKEADQQA